MSTPCSIAGGRSIGSRAFGWPLRALGDCQAWVGAGADGGCTIHGSATGALAGGGGGTGPGTGQLTCAEAVAGRVNALSASRSWRMVTPLLIVLKTERLQNLPLTSVA